MARDVIQVQYPTLDHTESVANICIETKAVTQANGITIAEAFSNKNNSLFIVIENTGTDSLLTVKAGDAYPNSMLGDIVVEIPQNISIVCLNDIKRIVRTDKSVHLIFDKNFNGTIYAFGILEDSE